jgi:diguanylate cyclase (GGDEF)-like protein
MKAWLKKQVEHIEDPYLRKKAEYTLIAMLLILAYGLISSFPMSSQLSSNKFYVVLTVVYTILLLVCFVVFKKNLLLTQYLFIITGFMVTIGYYINDLYFHFYIQIILVLFVHVIIHVKRTQLIVYQLGIAMIIIVRLLVLFYLLVNGDITSKMMNDHLFLSVSLGAIIVFIDYFSNIIQRDISERVRLDALVDKDPLTGISNRLFFNETVEHYHQEDILYQLAILDIDNFKMINDKYGHDKGDYILIELSRMLQSNFDHEDFSVFRWGGEEFVVLVKSRKLAESYYLLNAFRKKVMSHNFGTHEPVTVSIGLSEFDFEQSRETVFSNADSYLYKAKDLGRNCIVVKEGVHV